ncbi:MAG: class I SAM-dependent methyltransferase, partial [Pseudomonadota bacterium]
VYTAETLWTDPHLAKMMLQTHLSQDTALASRTTDAIERVVDWIDQSVKLNGKSVCDLGCGPGLYSNRFAERGAMVRGLDFSASSIEYARRNAPLNAGTVEYRIANYLHDPLPEQQDLVTLIYCDLCPLSPAQRRTLLTKIRQSLVQGGKLILDVYSKTAFDDVAERVLFGQNLMNGFWSSNDYFAFHHRFRYDQEAVSLDRFMIIEKDCTWSVFNWLQYFGQDDIRHELEQAGFREVKCVEGFGADSSDKMTFGVVASL